MKNLLWGIIMTLTVLTNVCCNDQPKLAVDQLDATAFAEKIKQAKEPIILDVRTVEEFQKNHIDKAINIDWTATNFKSEEEKLDKNKPLFVYCLSGIRSKEAAEQLVKDGFKEVHELKGGLAKWTVANLPMVAENNGNGITKEQFDKMLESDKIIIVDFNAEWCGPCKKLQPHLEEIAQTYKDQVKLISINTDDNPDLSNQFKIEAIPFIQVYKDKKLVWSYTGYIDKAELLQHIPVK